MKAYHLLRLLSMRAPVHLVTYHQGNAPRPEQLSAMRELDVTVHTVPLRRWLSAVHALSSLWTHLPIEISFYHQRQFQILTDDVIAAVQPSLVVSFFMRTAEYVRRRRDVPRLLVAEDCRQLYQQRSADATTSMVQRAVRRFEVRQLRTYEPRVMLDFDVATFVTQADIDAMKTSQPGGRYALLSNGVDLDVYTYGPIERSQTVLFCGKLNVEANHIMAMTLISDVWPLVSKAYPQASLVIAGSFPKNSLLARIRSQNVQFVDSPSSFVPLYHSAAVFAHPHRGGSGIQNKLLEAMACGCAVVTTPTGIQGIDAVNGVHALVTNSWEELATGIVRLLRTDATRNEIARNAREMIESTKSWQAIDAQLDHVLSVLGL